MTKSGYLYMLDRMKKDYIASKLHTTDLDNSLKSKSAIVENQI
jgi:hypothetical protein